MDADRPDPVRSLVVNVLLVKTLAVNAVGMPVQIFRPVFQIRQDERGDRPIVVNDISFGDTLSGKINLVPVGNRNFMAINF